MTGTSNYDLYEDDESFRRLSSLQRDYEERSIVSNQIKLMEEGLNNILSGITALEEEETIAIISSYDPVMWHVLNEYSQIGTDASPKQALKVFIILLKKNKESVMKQYSRILYRHLWGLRLKKEHRQFQEFATKNIERVNLITLVITSLIWIPVVLFIIFLISPSAFFFLLGTVDRVVNYSGRIEACRRLYYNY